MVHSDIARVVPPAPCHHCRSGNVCEVAMSETQGRVILDLYISKIAKPINTFKLIHTGILVDEVNLPKIKIHCNRVFELLDRPGIPLQEFYNFETGLRLVPIC